MNLLHPCPDCGKPMDENPTWPGAWFCPDSKIVLNDAPPYEFKCMGSELTEEACEAFDRECWRLMAERN